MPSMIVDINGRKMRIDGETREEVMRGAQAAADRFANEPGRLERGARLLGQAAMELPGQMAAGIGALPGLAVKYAPNVHGNMTGAGPESPTGAWPTTPVQAEVGDAIMAAGSAPGRALLGATQNFRENILPPQLGGGPAVEPQTMVERGIQRAPQIAGSTALGGAVGGPVGAGLALGSELLALGSEEGTAAVLRAMGEDPEAHAVMMAVIPMAVDITAGGIGGRSRTLGKLGAAAAERAAIAKLDEAAELISKKIGVPVSRADVEAAAAQWKSKAPHGPVSSPESLADLSARRSGRMSTVDGGPPEPALPGSEHMSASTLYGEEGGQAYAALEQKLAQNSDEFVSELAGNRQAAKAAIDEAFDATVGPNRGGFGALQAKVIEDLEVARFTERQLWDAVPIDEMPMVPARRLVAGAKLLEKSEGTANLPTSVREILKMDPDSEITARRLQSLSSDLHTAGRTSKMDPPDVRNAGRRAKLYHREVVAPIIRDMDARNVGGPAYKEARRATRLRAETFPEDSAAYKALVVDGNPTRAVATIAGAKDQAEQVRVVRRMLGDEQAFQSFGRAYVEGLMGNPEALTLGMAARRKLLHDNSAALVELLGEKGYGALRRIVESRKLLEWSKSGTRAAVQSTGTGPGGLIEQTADMAVRRDSLGVILLDKGKDVLEFISPSNRRLIMRHALTDNPGTSGVESIGELLLRAPVDAAKPAWQTAFNGKLIELGIIDQYGREIVSE